MTTTLALPSTRNIQKAENFEAKHLIFTSGLELKVADLETGSIDTLFSFKKDNKKIKPAWLESLAYHDHNLWVGCSYIGVRNVKDKKLFPRPGTVSSIVSFNGTLYDAGGYGIRETFANKIIVSEDDLNNRGVYKISDLFIHNDSLMAVCEWNIPGGGPNGYMLRNVERNGKIVAPYGNQPSIETHGLKQGKAISLDGGILSTLATTHVDQEEDWLLFDGKPVQGTHIKYGEYCSLAFDSARRILYAAFSRPRSTWYEPKQITAFKVYNNAGKISCDPIKEAATGLSGDVLALMLVNEQQLESIKSKNQRPKYLAAK